MSRRPANCHPRVRLARLVRVDQESDLAGGYGVLASLRVNFEGVQKAFGGLFHAARPPTRRTSPRKTIPEKRLRKVFT